MNRSFLIGFVTISSLGTGCGSKLIELDHFPTKAELLDLLDLDLGGAKNYYRIGEVVSICELLEQDYKTLKNEDNEINT